MQETRLVGENKMSKKMKVVKIITNSPLSFIGACSVFGDCNIINNNIYIVTTCSVKEIKDFLKEISTVAIEVRIVRDFTPQVLNWLEELQVNNIEGQLLHELLKTVKNVNS